ncbi:MAG: ATP-dependent sacrificial sulfur transferase LarE [Anaerosomatales bacterium]|nr:ATP-dependent sacrificial sulfur transferase LarE [Anaerosomatales bacterium]
MRGQLALRGEAKGTDTAVLALKHENLCNRLRNLGSALIAYSGGVDSTLVAFVAHAILGDRALAVLATSDVHTAEEIAAARDTAKRLGFRLLEVDTYEMSDPRFTENTPDRCYYCKCEMFGLLKHVAEAHGIDWVLDGTNADDVSDNRPGRRAAIEHGVISPLLEVGLHKDEVRELSRMLDLPTWNKPSMACLATRFPYGTPISEDGLARVMQAEAALRSLGLRQFRVRFHGDVARIEVDPPEMEHAWALRDEIAAAVKQAGFAFAAQDLEGYRPAGSAAPAEGCDRGDAVTDVMLGAPVADQAVAATADA